MSPWRVCAPPGTGRVDCNNIKGEPTPEPFTSMGDTILVRGGEGLGGAEVRSLDGLPVPVAVGAHTTTPDPMNTNASPLRALHSPGEANMSLLCNRFVLGAVDGHDRLLGGTAGETAPGCGQISIVAPTNSILKASHHTSAV